MRHLNPENRFIIAAATSLGVLQWLGSFAIDAQASFFCRPAAVFAAVILGGSSDLSPAGWTVTYRGIDAVVGIPCSGYTFFSILYSLLAGLAFRHRGTRGAVLNATLSLPFAYVLAVTANAARVAASCLARLVGQHLPEQIAGKLHLSVGVTIFLTSLIAVYWLAEKRYEHVRA